MRIANMLVAVAVAAAHVASADPLVIRYAAKTVPRVDGQPNTDYFTLVEDEQLFFVANGHGAAASAASKRAAEELDAFYKLTADEDATWPHPFDTKLSYVENRIVAGLRAANDKLHAARQRATGVAAVVSGSRVSIANVGTDRAYLIRNGRIEQLTHDHTLFGEYRRDHPDATRAELDRVPRKDVPTRVLGGRSLVDVELVSRDVAVGDRILLCSAGVTAALDDAAILAAIATYGVTKSDIEQAVDALVDRAQRMHKGHVTVMVLGFAAKKP